MLIERHIPPNRTHVGQNKKLHQNACSLSFKGDNLNLIGFEYKALKENFVFSDKNMLEGIHIDIITNGAWSLHHLIHHIIKQIGRCKLWISTYAVAANPAESLVFLKEKGLLEEIYLMTDRRLSEKKTKGFDILQTICNKVLVCENHSKMVALGNEFWKIKISSSANLTENKRFENVTVLFSEKSFEMTKKIITHGME